MSTTQYPQTECETCGESFRAGYNDSFCSAGCKWRHKGENVQRQINSDHTRCSTCYGRLKLIDPPTDDWKHKKGSGYQVALDHGATLSKEAGKQVLDYTSVTGTRPVDVSSVIGFEYYTPRVHKDHGLTYCQCGNVDHFGESEEIRNVNPNEVIQNLWSLLVEYYKKGQFGDNRPNQELLIEGLKESGLDYVYSAGKCVYES